MPEPGTFTELRATTATERKGLAQITRGQWRAGIAAWLGWTFDGLDMHLYTLVAAPFVAELLGNLTTTDPAVGRYGSYIQASFLLGWALGGGFFGRLGDRLGRTRALNLTILTYAAFTGLSFFATQWWHLLIYRFLAALGIGGEWAVGASLLAETWPKHWRPWIAAVLQTGVNVGIIAASLAYTFMAQLPSRCVFLVGILPALLVLWIRRAVPETAEWKSARTAAIREPKLRDLFVKDVRNTTFLIVLVCAVSLTAHWAFMFWHQQHLRNLPEVLALPSAERNRLASLVMFLVIGSSIAGNFFAGAVSRRLGYRKTLSGMFLTYFLALLAAYCLSRDYHQLLWFYPVIGFCQGVFALFTMYLPPLFPTLLRTTGAGFCYNIGRVFAAVGTVFFGTFSKVGDHRVALYYSGFLFVPAAFICLLLPAHSDR